MNILEVSQITKHFSGLVALDNISFNVNKSEIVGLIGPNGAGKTTLFNIIAGSLKPTRGKISFDGKNITGLPTNRICRLGLARTFQIPKPFEDLTVLQNIEMAEMFGHATGEGKKRVGSPMEICEIVGLSPKNETLARILSASDKKRLEVARALATSPRILLLDEFAAGLSAQESEWASSFVKDMQRSFELSIIWIEHVMRILMKNVDRVFVLDHGVKIAEGTPKEVVNNAKVLQAYLGGSA
ncbi:MAG: ABC transporter ATP-binding protein [archaeon]|nr:ABC transporter ATP-binding protein [archaeon]